MRKRELLTKSTAELVEIIETQNIVTRLKSFKNDWFLDNETQDHPRKIHIQANPQCWEGHDCEAVQHSDQLVCKRCDLVWDVNDLYEPPCGHESIQPKQNTNKHNIFEILGAATGISGAIMMAYNPAVLAAYAFPIWTISTILLMLHAHKTGMKYLFTLQLTFFVVNIYGIVKNTLPLF